MPSKEIKKIISPKRLVLIMACAIYICEALTMFILGVLPPVTELVKALIDSTILLLLLIPIYLSIYRPVWKDLLLKQDQILKLSHRLLTSVEEERKHVSQEIHDQCGATLAAMQFGAENLKSCIPEEQCGYHDQIDKMITLTTNLSQYLRRVSAKLRPASLDELGFITALEHELRLFANHYEHISFNWRLCRKTDLPLPLDPGLEVAAYRICQEALTNIVRHAKASSADLNLWLDKGFLHISVTDDGRGFDVNHFWRYSARHQGIGLLGLRERAANLGGIAQVNSSPGQGTIIKVELPLQKELT